MSAAKFTTTKEKRTADAPTYTVQPMAQPFGWVGEKRPRRGSQMGTPRAQRSSLGNMEPGRLSQFEQGARESFDSRACTAAVMVGTYIGVKAWSAWRGHQRDRGTA
jgi:hypothetical protein